MIGSPRGPAREPAPVSTTPPKPRGEPQLPQRASTSRYAKPPGAHSAPKPKVLMGEVTAPRGLEIGKQREAFRAFMMARHLRPTEWARCAGVPAGEILGFLTGKIRTIAPATLEKLAQAAHCKVEDFFS
jgi:DNA-binding Xre family transcriptional regulator